MKLTASSSSRTALVSSFAAFTLGSVAVAQTWTRQTPVPFGLEIEHCHAVSAAEMWAVGDEGVVLHTTDAGATWDMTDLATDSLSAVFFLDDGLHGWVAGNAFFHTTDGGQTWIKDNSWGSVYDIQFVDALCGYACGNGGTTYRTSDGGLTWNWSTVGPITTLSSIWFQTTQVGWTANIEGEIYKSSDGGATWTLKASTGAANLVVQFVSPTVGWAIGGSAFLKTTDGGDTWVPQSAPGEVWSYDAYWLDEQHGWTMGNNPVRTTDGGLTWVPMPEAFSYRYLWSVHFADALHGYYVGDGAILRGTSDGGATWSSLTNGTGWAHGIDAIDPAHAWIASNGGETAYTVDGGERWERVYMPGMDVYGRVEDIDFVDLSSGWACGISSSFAADGGVIQHSNDGGKTWSVQLTYGSAMHEVEAISPSTAFVIGEIYTQTGYVLRTTDGGASWVDVSPSGAWESDACFLDDQTGWLTGASIYKTTDGGSTWTQQHTTGGSAEYLESIDFADADHGWSVGWFGNVLRTTNGGQTWVKQTVPSGYGNVVLEVRAIDANTAWITGMQGYAASTTDGGATWTKEVIEPGFLYSFECAFFFDLNNGWAGGNHAYPKGGLYLRSTPWSKVGSGLSGVHGVPALSGTGALTPGSTIKLTLSGGAKSAIGFLVLGLSQVDFPLLGGTLVPFPTVVLPAPTDAFGASSTSFTWPSGTPAGSQVFAQQWLVDAAGPLGYSASNGVTAAQP
jgi:photosystem II stability/assembly factor-like uncharacterized protein